MALPVTIGILSFGARQTLASSLASHVRAGLFAVASQSFVFFNAITDEDRELAARFGLACSGSDANLGIYGGFKQIAERASQPYVLILENDISTLPGLDVEACVATCVGDMTRERIRVFSLRSRLNPGAGSLWGKYVRCYAVQSPLRDGMQPKAPGLRDRAGMLARHGYLSKFKGTAIYVETNPEAVHPAAIRRLPSGNYVTDSRYRNWSNQSVLVEREYFLSTICPRVENYPDQRLVNGAQDIERALNCAWWRRQREPLGHAAQGIFTHARLDR
jgi:hypothetical protein